jgi:hypothetical protein
MAFKLSPEFSDGTSYMIVKNKKELMDSIESWADEAHHYPNELATVEYVDMSDEEIDALPEI